MCQRAPLVPGFGTLTDLAASSPTPFGSTVGSTPLVPVNSPLTKETLKALYGTEAPPDGSEPQGPPTTQDRLEAMAAQARAVEAKRSMGWSKLTSVIPQVQCGMAYINQSPFFNRGYVQCGLLNEAPIDGKTVGSVLSASGPPLCPSAKAGQKHYSNHLGGKPSSALWWPHEWHGQEGRYGVQRSQQAETPAFYGVSPPTWSSGTSQMPQYVAGRTGYMVDPWGSAHLN